MKYDFDDNELIYMIRENDDEALYLLMKKYEPLIKNIAFSSCKKHDNMAVDYEDLVQELRLTLFRAVKNYNDGLESKFFSYLFPSLYKGSIRYFDKAIYYSDKINETLIEDNKDFDIYNGDNNFIHNAVSDYDFDNNVINFKHELDFFDSCVFELRYSYFSYKDIASLLGVSLKKIDNSLFKIKNKLRKYLNDLA